MHVAPDITKPYVATFCASVVPGSQALSVPSTPLTGAPQNECVIVVPAHAATHGGEQVLGWAIWERPGVFIEAEFHSVWRNPGGALLDIMPRPFPVSEIVFLPDPSLIYRGRQIDNHRKALVADHDVTRYLYLFRRQFEILNAGERADQYEVELPPRARREWIQIDKELQRLHRRLEKKYGP